MTNEQLILLQNRRNDEIEKLVTLFNKQSSFTMFFIENGNITMKQSTTKLSFFKVMIPLSKGSKNIVLFRGKEVCTTELINQIISLHQTN